MKKAIAFLLTAVMAASLTACGGSSSSGNSASSSDSSAAGASAAGTTAAADTAQSTAQSMDSADMPTVKLSMGSVNNIPSDEARTAVENALDDYIHGKGYNFNVSIELIPFANYTNDVSMRLAGGEEMDIVQTGLDSFNSWISNGYYTSLEPYREDLKDALAVVGDWEVCGMVNGTLYAMPVYKGLSLDYKYIYNEDYYKDIDMSNVKSLEDLDGVFAQFKEKYPDELPATDAYNEVLVLTAEEDHTAVVSTYLATVGDSTQLVSLFDTDAYKKACEKAYEWRQKGYVDPEGSAQTLLHDELVMSGKAKGVTMGHAYSVETIERMFDSNNTYGATFKAVSIGQSLLASNELTYGVAYTSKHPKEAAQFIDLIWSDEYVMSTIIYGLEGTSWVWNADKTSIQYPEGLDINSVPYTVLYSCGAFGNQFLLYPMDDNTSESDKEFMENLNNTAYVAPYFGFNPSADNVSTQVAAVSNVYNQYDKALRYGDVDPDTYLPQFQAELEAAGINDIIADYQAQADAWRAENSK